MFRSPPRDDSRVRAVRHALRSYAWRTWTTEMMARQVLGALDAHQVRVLMAGLSPSPIASTADHHPAERDDERLWVLADFLSTCRWRALTLTALSERLVSALDRWWFRRRCLDIELHRLLNGAD